MGGQRAHPARPRLPGTPLHRRDRSQAHDGHARLGCPRAGRGRGQDDHAQPRQPGDADHEAAQDGWLLVTLNLDVTRVLEALDAKTRLRPADVAGLGGSPSSTDATPKAYRMPDAAQERGDLIEAALP